MSESTRVFAMTWDETPEEEFFPNGEYVIEMEVPKDFLHGQSLKSINSREGRIALAAHILPDDLIIVGIGEQEK